MTSEAFLDDVIRKFGNLRDRAENVLADLNEDQMNQAIPGFHWTLAQVCEHVLLAHGHYVAVIEEALERPTLGGSKEVGFSFMGRQIAKYGGPDGGAPVPRSVMPNLAKRYPLEIRTELLDQTEALAALARKAVGVDLAAVRRPNPFFPLFKMTLADYFNIPERHLEHHVRQLEKYAPAVKGG